MLTIFTLSSTLWFLLEFPKKRRVYYAEFWCYTGWKKWHGTDVSITCLKARWQKVSIVSSLLEETAGIKAANRMRCYCSQKRNEESRSVRLDTEKHRGRESIMFLGQIQACLFHETFFKWSLRIYLHFSSVSSTLY